MQIRSGTFLICTEEIPALIPHQPPAPCSKYLRGHSRIPGCQRIAPGRVAHVPACCPGKVPLRLDRKIYTCYPCSQGLMSSGEVISTRSTGEGWFGTRIALSTRSDSRSCRSGIERFPVPLLLCCILAAALCGPVSAGEGKYAPLWEKGADDAVSSVAIARDGSAVVAGSGLTISLLDGEGNLLWKTTAGSYVNDVSISPEGSYIGVAADKIYLFDSDGNLIWTERTGYIYRSVALSSNGTYIAVSCDNGAIFTFNQDKEMLWDYDMGTDGYGIAISDNGRRIALGCDNQGVYLLNSGDGESWSYGTGKRVKGIAITPDGRFVAAGSLDRCVYLSTGEGEHLWKYPTEEAVLSTALTDEAREVLAASGKTIHILDRQGAEIQKITPGGRVESIAVTSDGRFLVSGSGDGDRSIRLFTNDAALIEHMGSTELTVNETEPSEKNVTVSTTSADGNPDTAAKANAPAGGISITSQVRGWLENIFSLLFEPREDFFA